MPKPLSVAHRELGWPRPHQIFTPEGAGPRVLANLAEQKIGNALRRLPDSADAKVGVLVEDPAGSRSAAPLAIVCEFSRSVSPDTLYEAHRLAWNFSRSPLLLTVEPHVIRAWTCCEIPATVRRSPPDSWPLKAFDSPEVPEDSSPELQAFATDALTRHAAEVLHWVNLVTGALADHYPQRFQQEFRADHTLLENLRYVRNELNLQGLSYPIIHDLLARLIFIQFLFDRKDSAGKAALDADRLRRFHEQGFLKASHATLSDVLRDHGDAYALFRILDRQFNGDLFPTVAGNSNDSVTVTGGASFGGKPEASWAEEMRHVTPGHLTLLSNFVSGTLQMADGQYSLWRLYSFDAIPLEFISSVYEEFVAKQPGVVYTPAFLVDFILDTVLPWGQDEWNLRILDPACGSGIFLVKAFQRLVHRWKRANPNTRIEARQLRELLELNLLGVDKDEDAVRVASFSLYLAMCDEIDPRHYWQQVKFPRLRGRRLLAADFFQEDVTGIRTIDDAEDFDLVIGNVPWARGSLRDSQHALTWSKTFGWKAFDKNIGPLFLPKAVALVNQRGRVALLQPASLLFADFASAFREKIFSEFGVEEVVNLSPLRFQLFQRSRRGSQLEGRNGQRERAGAVGPACLMILKGTPPSAAPITYVSPKPTHRYDDQYRMTIEPHDVAHVHPSEAIHGAIIWSTLAWGGRRDLALVRRLAQGNSLAKLKQARRAAARNGLMWHRKGKGKRRHVAELEGRLELLGSDLPTQDCVYLDTSALAEVTDPYIHHKDQVDLTAFSAPQILLKRSWSAKTGRFGAALVPSDHPSGGVICSQNFVSVHVHPAWVNHLEAACLSYNSQLAVYYLLLTSGRIASERPNVRVRELLELPYPTPNPGLLRDVCTHDDFDKGIREAFGLDDVEWALVEDLQSYTMPDFKGRADSPGRAPTRHSTDTHGKTNFRRDRSPQLIEDPHVASYCETFIRVLSASLGDNPSATIFQTPERLPVRLVAIHFQWPGREVVTTEFMKSEALRERLVRLSELLDPSSGTRPARFRRVMRVYSSFSDRGLATPTVYLVKPDEIRYWTRSAALRDADEVVADAVLWLAQSKNNSLSTKDTGRV